MGISEIEPDALSQLLNIALQARFAALQPGEPQAVRLFNGQREGHPETTVELFGKTLVIFDNSRSPSDALHNLAPIWQFYLSALPWIEATVIKSRYASVQMHRQGHLVTGTQPDRKIREHGIWYAIDLRINQDASFYLDTRNLRRWALDHLAGKRVLNTFAYTGSLGVAAQAAGASLVMQLDLNRKFLEQARASCALNQLPDPSGNYLIGDFFTWIGRLKRMEKRFDCIFLDPPFFSITNRGRIDLERESHQLINKVRPLIAEGGWLVTINNALFLSGEAYHHTLEGICADGFMEIETIIPVPPDVTGYPHTIMKQPPTDPAPFNDATKIAILRVLRRKSP